MNKMAVMTTSLKSKLYQRRIAHNTTINVANNRYITIFTLEIRLTKSNSEIVTLTIYHRIFDATKQIDSSAASITIDKVHIAPSKDIPSTGEHKEMVKELRTCDIIKSVYVSFKLESTHTVSQLKYEPTINGYEGMFDTVREHFVFLEMNKFQSHTGTSIGFFLGINPKLTLRNVLKEKIDDICT